MAKRDLMDYISEQLTGDLRKIMEAIGEQRTAKGLGEFPHSQEN